MINSSIPSELPPFQAHAPARHGAILVAGDQKDHSQGFTLIELLVVISIIAVLAALAFPVFGKVKEQQGAVGCMHNLRQIGMGMQMYANDHDNTLPVGWIRTRSDWPWNFWYGAIYPYTATTARKISDNMALSFDGVMHDPGKKNWSLGGPTDVNRVSYAMNSFVPWDPALAGSGVAMNRAAIAQPSKTTLVVDQAGGAVVIPNTDILYNHPPCQIHHGNDNVLFCDGHVQSVAKKGLVDTAAMGLMLP